MFKKTLFTAILILAGLIWGSPQARGQERDFVAAKGDAIDALIEAYDGRKTATAHNFAVHLAELGNIAQESVRWNGPAESYDEARAPVRVRCASLRRFDAILEWLRRTAPRLTRARRALRGAVERMERAADAGLDRRCLELK